MEPSVRLLRYFLAVADAGTFTAAAEVLHVSQPALSQQIRKLEGELGFTLFQRGTRQVTLTPHGRDLISSARQVVEAAQTYRSHARRLAGGTQKLTIGYRAAHEATRAVVDAFRAERPDITIDVRHYPIAATHAGLDTGEVDLAVLRLPVVLTGLHTLTLYTEPRVALLPSGHPLACRTRIHLADLAGLPWITTAAQDPVWQAHAQPTAERDKPDAPVIVATLDEFLEAVITGRGVGLAPASAARLYARPGVAFIEVADAEPSVGALAWRDGVPDANPTVAAFIRSARLFVRRQRQGQRPEPTAGLGAACTAVPGLLLRRDALIGRSGRLPLSHAQQPSRLGRPYVRVLDSLADDRGQGHQGRAIDDHQRQNVINLPRRARLTKITQQPWRLTLLHYLSSYNNGSIARSLKGRPQVKKSLNGRLASAHIRCSFTGPAESRSRLRRHSSR